VAKTGDCTEQLLANATCCAAYLQQLIQTAAQAHLKCSMLPATLLQLSSPLLLLLHTRSHGFATATL
jgi:hypothetical protein